MGGETDTETDRRLMQAGPVGRRNFPLVNWGAQSVITASNENEYFTTSTLAELS
jgi:hypothetical protein